MPATTTTCRGSGSTSSARAAERGHARRWPSLERVLRPPLYPLTIATRHGITGLEAGAAMLAAEPRALRVDSSTSFGGWCSSTVSARPTPVGRSHSTWRRRSRSSLSSALTEPLFVVAGSGFTAGDAPPALGARRCARGPHGLDEEHRGTDGRAAGRRGCDRPAQRGRNACPTGCRAIRRSGALPRLRTWRTLGSRVGSPAPPRAPFLTQRYGWGNTVGNPVVNLVTNLDRWQYVAVLALLALSVRSLEGRHAHAGRRDLLRRHAAVGYGGRPDRGRGAALHRRGIPAGVGADDLGVDRAER